LFDGLGFTNGNEMGRKSLACASKDAA